MNDLDDSQYVNSSSYRYHVLTKHSLESLHAKSAPLDWALQPDPFRIYAGCSNLTLPRQMPVHELDLFQLIRVMLYGHGEKTADNFLPPPAVPSDLQLISSLLYFSMAISAWKQIKGTEHKWALRVNPSSGNLHPTETHVLVRGVAGIADGAYHYSVKDHSLEARSENDVLSNVWSLLGRATVDRPQLLLVLSSIFWREAWKYKDRAFRYCQLDLGHAAAAVCLAAAGFGFASEVIAEFPDLELAAELGLTGSDEKPMLLIPIYPDLLSAGGSCETDQSETGISSKGAFVGQANVLSRREVFYQSIQDVFKATCLSRSEYFASMADRRFEVQNYKARALFLSSDEEKLEIAGLAYKSAGHLKAVELIRKRRSAVDMDGRLRISLARMSCILIDSTRGFASTYSSVIPFNPSQIEIGYFIHIIVYAHRVDGIAPGVYYFDRNKLELSCLNEGNVRSQAKFVSCLQDIAADGVFAVSLLADMKAAFNCFGERSYRYVHQEAGFIGQLFYLTARALGIDATGIGCFLDDEINQSLPPGMEAVYNFTFGKAVEDPRLTDLPAYDFIV